MKVYFCMCAFLILDGSNNEDSFFFLFCSSTSSVQILTIFSWKYQRQWFSFTLICFVCLSMTMTMTWVDWSNFCFSSLSLSVFLISIFSIQLYSIKSWMMCRYLISDTDLAQLSSRKQVSWSRGDRDRDRRRYCSRWSRSPRAPYASAHSLASPQTNPNSSVSLVTSSRA